MSRTKKGVNLIKKTVSKFQNIINGLEKGIELCEKDVNTNGIKIQTLTDENKIIEESKVLALTFKTNLSNMLKTPTSTIEKKED